MEIIITVLNILILGLIIIAPIIILLIANKYRIKNTLIFYSIAGFIVLGILVWTLAWWGHESDLILLKQYGYNIDGMNETEFYGNVLPENLEKVKKLETSIMGVGWPLKAIFGIVTVIPYLIIVYMGKVWIDKSEDKKNVA